MHVNEQRVKPARAVNVGNVLRIQRGHQVMEVVVKNLSDRRGPASEAALLYEETAASIARRQTDTEQRRLNTYGTPLPERRPNKKERRQIIRFIRRSDSDS